MDSNNLICNTAYLLMDNIVVNYNSKLIYCALINLHSKSFYYTLTNYMSRDVNVDFITSILSAEICDVGLIPKRGLYISKRDFNKLRYKINSYEFK